VYDVRYQIFIVLVVYNSSDSIHILIFAATKAN